MAVFISHPISTRDTHISQRTVAHGGVIVPYYTPMRYGCRITPRHDMDLP